MTEVRPVLSSQLTGQELQRWYWLRSELADLARELGIPAGGGKQALTARVVAHLEGGPPPPPPAPRRPAAPALPEPLGAATVIPAGQRCSQQLRRYLTATIGSSFTFDAAMREFVATGAGRTLGDAVSHWYATRSESAHEIGAQFELNAFLRSWHGSHPGRSHAEALDAWRHHRRLPAEAREPLP